MKMKGRGATFLDHDKMFKLRLSTGSNLHCPGSLALRHTPCIPCGLCVSPATRAMPARCRLWRSATPPARAVPKNTLNYLETLK